MQQTDKRGDAMIEDENAMTDYILGTNSDLETEAQTEVEIEVVYTLEELLDYNLARQAETAAPAVEEPAINYPINNFMRGSVTEGRLRHECNTQHSGLAHWRHNTSKQRDHDDGVLQANLDPRKRYNSGEVRYLEGYGASVSPGMGLESENLHSFILRNRGTEVDVSQPETAAVAPESVAPESVEPEVALPANSNVIQMLPAELRSGAPAPDIACKFRRMKTTTFTNLVARALNG